MVYFEQVRDVFFRIERDIKGSNRRTF